jgi:hypothetical protein
MKNTHILRNTTAAVAAITMAFALLAPTLANAQVTDLVTDQVSSLEGVEAKVADRKEKAEERIEERRLTAETKTVERIRAACERRVEKLDKSMDTISTKATRLLGVMDSYYEKIKGFYDKGRLTVPNYAELLASVATAQEKATTEIAILNALNIEIDCTDPEVVLGVSSFKESATASKEALREYRSSLIALITDMRSAIAEASDTNDSSVDQEKSKAEDSNTDTDSTEGEN